jgi:hypothetical protein
MRHRKLTDFMPLYSTAKTGALIIDEPPRDETPDLTTAELDKLAGDEMPVKPSAPPLPLELGNLPERMPTGTRVIIGKHNLELVRAGKDTDDAPQYRLRHNLTLTGNAIFTVDDLNIMGAKLVLDKLEAF